MGLLDWFRKRRKTDLGSQKPNAEIVQKDSETEALERTRKLLIEIEESLDEKPD